MRSPFTTFAPVAVLGLAAGIALAGAAASVPYVRSRTTDGRPDAGDGGHCLAWRPGTVTFHQNVAGAPDLGDAGFAAVHASLGTWQAQMDACGSLALDDGPRTESRSVGYVQASASNENVVLFRTRRCEDTVASDDACHAAGTCANAHDCWDFSSTLLAVTTSSYDARTGLLLDTDVELNAASHLFTAVDAPPCATPARDCVSTDVANTVTHELGHALGLAHSPDPRSTMFAGAAEGETSKRLLDDGSRRFVCDVYPKGRPSQDCRGDALDLSEVQSSCASVPVRGATLTPVSAVLLVLAARRRRGP